MELIKEPIKLNEVCIQDFSDVMVDGDVIVPDIKPDILKILQVDANAVITNKDVSDGKVTLNGKADFKILYIPDDKEQSVKSIQSSFDFVHLINDAKAKPGMSLTVECDVSQIDANMINSRKINIKAIVSVDTRVYSDAEIPVVTGIESDKNIQIKTSKLNVYNIKADTEADFVLRDSLEVPSGKSGVSEILKNDIKICDTEYKAVTGKVVAQGTVSICTLYISDDLNRAIDFMEHEIPFTEIFDVDDMTEAMDCDIDFEVTDFKCETLADSDGDMRVLETEVCVKAHIKSSENTELDMVDDCYCTEGEIILKRQKYSMDKFVCESRSRQTLKEIISVDSDMPPIMGVYNVITKPYITSATTDTDRVMIEGVVDVYILYLSDSDNSPVFSCKKEIPFNYMLDAQGAMPGMRCEIKAEMEHSSYSISVANEIELRCIIALPVKVFDKCETELITDAQLETGNNTGVDASMVVYFAQNGDELWDIAKHYRVAAGDITAFNNMEDGSVKQGQKIIIPCRTTAE